MKRTIEVIDKEIEAQRENHRKAAECLEQEHKTLEKLLDERDNKIVEGFDSSLVEETKSLDINPTNYETENALRGAIQYQKQFNKFSKENE